MSFLAKHFYKTLGSWSFIDDYYQLRFYEPGVVQLCSAGAAQFEILKVFFYLNFITSNKIILSS
tara:strand:- start:24 stop:215 length:192 start_codon:yes stop_codon:yes gene_type:complete